MNNMGNQKFYKHKCRKCGLLVKSKNQFELGIKCTKCEVIELDVFKKQKENELSTQVINNCIFCQKQVKTNLHDNKGFCGEECKTAERLRVEVDDRKKEVERKDYEFKSLVCKNVPKKFVNSDFSFGFDIDSIYNKSLFITGDSGVGKTTLMAMLAKKYLKDGIGISWISFASFIIHLQHGFKSGDNDPFAKAIEVAEFPGIVMIDDLGAEKTTEYVRQIIYYILNDREQTCLPIIITSNLSVSEISTKSDKRIASRIAGMCKQIKLTGKDRRIK